MNREFEKHRFDYFIKVFLITLLVGISTTGEAEDAIQLEIVTVQGSRELPKVLYIVPWKRLESNPKNQKLILHSLFQDVFDPLEPEAFERRVNNFQKSKVGKPTDQQ